MRVLLLGEYSGVHNNLSKALREDGHEVCLISDGDGYKSFHSDIVIKYTPLTSKSRFLKKFLKIFNLALLYTGLAGTLQILKHLNTIKSMKDYDVVQLINPVFLSNYGSIVNLLVFKYLSKNNKKIFLSALGDDYQFVKYCLKNRSSPNIFYNFSFKNLKYYLRPLMYIYGFLYPKLHNDVVNRVDAIIPGLYDYYEVYRSCDKCTEIIPIIVDSSHKKALELKEYPIYIFHGWQKGRTCHKGNDIFDEAINRLIQEYPDKVSYRIVSGLPYEDYIQAFNSSHIFIDQCFSKDRGVNALLGMKSGKVVFSGFDIEVKKYYQTDSNPLINAIPDAQQIYVDLKSLVTQPNLIESYSEKSIEFIKSYHNSKYVLSKYYKVWSES